MLLLVTTAHTSFVQHPDPDTGAPVHEHLGRLLQPRHTSSAERTASAGIPWACDNDCFNGLDENAYVDMLARVEGLPGCRFVTVPDVVRCSICRLTVDGYGGGGRCPCDRRQRGRTVFGDAELTVERFQEWEPIVDDARQPKALVLQDGQDAVGVAWDAIDAVFVGGSDDFKLSEGAAEWCRQAKLRGKWVHWGRVNSRRRFAHCIGTGAADSCDGSSWAKFRLAVESKCGTPKLDKGLRWIREMCADPPCPQLALAA